MTVPNIPDTYDMDTFGKPVSITGSTPNPYRYGAAWGYITDPSGFLQLGARYYWPEVGRFVQQDPEGNGANWYVYAEDNPVVWSDASGLAAGQSLRGHGPRGHGRASGGRGRGGAGLGGSGGRPCPRPSAKPKPKPKPRSADCTRCDAAYLRGWKAITGGIDAGQGADLVAGEAAERATGSSACGAAAGPAFSMGQMANVYTAVTVNQYAYQQCCEKYHCEQLGASQLARGAGGG